MKGSDFVPNKELIAFAEMFSGKFKSLSTGLYCSLGKAKYKIEYLDRIEAAPNTKARASLDRGTIQLDKKALRDEHEAFCYYLIIWCAAHFKLKDYFASDTAAINHYISTGKPKGLLYRRISDLLKTNIIPENDSRIVNIGLLLLPHIPKNANSKI